jgi:hypothetical protein
MFERWLAPEFLLARWAAKAKGGDRKAFARMYEALYPPIERYVARLVREKKKASTSSPRVFSTCSIG